jgi:hypothetical protein
LKNDNFILSITVFLPLFIIFASCRKQEAQWGGTIEVIGEMTVVKNPKEPMYGEEAFSLEEELSITDLTS